MVADYRRRAKMGLVGRLRPTAVLNGFTITRGRAVGGGIDDNGGGALVVDASPVIARCTVMANDAAVGGGGIEVMGTSTPFVIGCSFINNVAIEGSGMRLVGSGTTQVVNCLFAYQLRFGGAIWAHGPGLEVINCTFFFNDHFTTGIFNIANESQVTITNSIISFPEHPYFVIEPGSSVTVSFSDVDCQPGFEGCLDAEGVTQGLGNIDADPQFVDGFGGSNFRLGHLCSPCIDRGYTNAVPSDSFDVNNDGDTDEPTPDRDIMPRIVDGLQQTGGGLVVDMGAYEFVPPSCPWDCEANPEGTVGIVDFLDLLIQWGQECTSCDFGVGAPGVGINEFLELLMRWSTVCPASSAPPPPTVQEELDDACLTQDDWDEYVDVMTDEASSQFKKNRYDCWMRHYIIDCSKCSCPGGQGHLLCPGQDPFN